MVKLAVLIDALNRESGRAGRRRARGATPDDADRRHPQAARAHRPARRCRRGSSRGRGRRREPGGGGRELAPTAAGRARLLPRRLAGGERAGHRATPSGRSARLLVQRRQQPRRRHRLRRLRAGARCASKTCLVFNTIGPDRAETMRAMLGHLGGCRFYDADGRRAAAQPTCSRGSTSSACRCARRYAGEDGWRARRPAREPGRLPPVLRRRSSPRCCARYGRRLLAERALAAARAPSTATSATRALAGGARRASRPARPSRPADAGRAAPRLAAFVADVREEYFTVLAHLARLALLPHARRARRARPGKYAAKRRGFVVSMGEDLGAVKISGWTHTIPEYFDFDRFWAGYPGARERGGVEVTRAGRTRPHAGAPRARLGHAPPLPDQLAGDRRRGPRQPGRRASVQGLQRAAHAQRRAGRRRLDLAVPERVRLRARRRVDGRGRATHYEGDSVYERKALTDTEYAAYLVDFTRRVLGLDHRGGDARSSRRSPASTSRRWTRSGARSFELLIDQLRPAHADRARTSSRSSSRGRGATATGRTARASRRLPREHGHQVPAPARDRRQRRTPRRAACTRSPTAARPRSPTACCACCTSRACSATPATTCASTCGRAATRAAASSAAWSRRSSRRAAGEVDAAQPLRRGASRCERAGAKIDLGAAARADAPSTPSGATTSSSERWRELAAALPQAPARHARAAASSAPTTRCRRPRASWSRRRSSASPALTRRRLPLPGRGRAARRSRRAATRAAPSRCACSPSCASASRFADLGGKALSSIEYLTDGGRAARRRARGRRLPRARRRAAAARARWPTQPAASPAGAAAPPAATAASRSPRATTSLPPRDAARDVLVDRLRRLRERVVRARLRLAHRQRGRARSAGATSSATASSAGRATSAPTCADADGARGARRRRSSSTAASSATSSARCSRAPRSGSTARARATSA